MSDLRRLLHDAAPTPTRPFDAQAFVRRARTSSRRRLVAWLGAVVAGVTAVVVPGQLILTPAGPGDPPVEALRVPTTTTTTTLVAGAVTTDTPDRDSDPRTPVEGNNPPSADPDPAVIGPVSPAAENVTVATPWTSAGGEGCWAYSTPTPGPTGAVEGPSETVWECEYTATAPAGYEGRGGTWTVEITRGGETTTYDSVGGPACQPVGVVQPGDHVRAHLGVRTPDGGVAHASAGEKEWYIRVGTWVTC